MRQLSGLDAQFLALESPRTYGHIGGLAVYDPSTAEGGFVDFARLKQLVSDRIHLLPPFRSRLVSVPFGLDLPYWADDRDFDLDFHMREWAVPPPGNDRQLAEVVAQVFSRPLDRSRPLWELHMVHGLPGDRIGLLSKIHHAVIDGVSGGELMSILFDPSADVRATPPTENGAHGERIPRDAEMLARGLLGVPRQGVRAFRSAGVIPNLPNFPGANLVPGLVPLSRGVGGLNRRLRRRAPRGVLEAKVGAAPRTPFNGRVSAHRRFAFGSVPLSRVKAIKDASGVTVNDVVVTLVAGVLRRWLLERDALPDAPLIAAIPVSVRDVNERGVYGNRISMMIVPIPTDEADAGKRLERTHEALKNAKEKHKALPASLLTDATAFIPPAVAARASRTTLRVLSRVRPPVNVVISNVPGPREALYCAGARLENQFAASIVVDGVGLNITVLSYRDKIDFGITADREQVDDIWSLITDLATELDELGAQQP